MIAWLHDVASHLSELAAVPWVVRDHEHRPGEAWMLKRLRIDGGALFVCPPRGYTVRHERETHLEFTACWPEHPRTRSQFVPWDAAKRDYVRLRRVVAVARPARIVAREIHRHILTRYEALYSEAWGEQQREIRHERETEAFADELVALGGERLTRERPTVHLGRVVFEATGGNDVRLRDAYVSRDVARRIAEILGAKQQNDTP